MSNVQGRFELLRREMVDDGWARRAPCGEAPPRTQVSIDPVRQIITRNRSPDVPFEQSINPYRGCEHGCVYCFARPTHTYLGLSAGLDFETKLFARPDAPERLRRELARPGYRCQVIAMGTNTDPYQPVEKRWKVTRGILEVLAEHDHPVSIVTKSALVERDIDLLAPMAEKNLAQVMVSVTSLDRELSRRLEPRAANPYRRIETIRRLNEAGIPTGVLVAPVIPALTDSYMERILESCAAAGACSAGYLVLRLPHEVKALFRQWLEVNAPQRGAHVMSVLQAMRGGRDNDPRFGVRQRGLGAFAQLIATRFRVAARRLGLDRSMPLSETGLFTPPGPVQGKLF